MSEFAARCLQMVRYGLFLAIGLVVGAGVTDVCAQTGSEDAACVECHKEMRHLLGAKEPAQFACSKCHDAASTRITPHGNIGRMKKGSIAIGSQTCVACHDKEPYAKMRHGSLAEGCTGCHESHSAKHGKVRMADTASLCYSCHESKAFNGKVMHKPVRDGDCADCHTMHASEHRGLLSETLTKTCLVCHGKVSKTPHAAAGASGKGHPVGGGKDVLQDPARPDQPFTCGSCHDPHVSEHPRLMRFDLKSPYGFCQKCHRI